MNMMPTISVIIPVPCYEDKLPVLSYLAKADYPKDKLEIILVIGRWPSLQRNEAVKTAKGEILYFFNSDAQLTPDIFKKAVAIINKREDIAGAGGPDLTPGNNNYIQHLLGYAMSSYFAHWKMRARYSRIGEERISNEKELLLSNLAIKRGIYLKAGGFNDRLYPNEENELINRVSEMGYKFIYNPDMAIYRDRRKTLFAFAGQFYRYGHGRMQQVFIEGPLKNAAFIAPIFLLVYFLIIPIFKNTWWVFLPLLAYIVLGTLDTIYVSIKNGKKMLIGLLPCYIIMHLSYAVGAMCSIIDRLFIRRNRRIYSDNLDVIIIKKFGEK